MNAVFIRLLFIALPFYAILMTACDVDGDTVGTVDDAVKLLQDVDRDGVWDYLFEGADALAEQSGYTARIEVSDARGTAAIINIHVDGAGNAQYELNSDTVTRRYIVPTGEDTVPSEQVYQITDGGPACADNAMIMLFSAGITGIFTAFELPAQTEQTLAVAEPDGDSTVLDRDADHYSIESRLAEALDILERTDHADLRERIANDTLVSFTGNFDLDDETGALLAFTGKFQEQTLVFEVQQWEDVPEITLQENLPKCD